MIAITIGEIIIPKRIPNLDHNLFKGFKNFEFIKPKIKKDNEINNGKILILLKFPSKFQKATTRNTTKKTKPKLRLELILILDIYVLLFFLVSYINQMSHAKKNLLTILISTILSIFLLYFLFLIKISFENHEKAPYLFTTIDKLNFHKNYSKKLHHLRDSDGKWEINENYANYLFSTINEFSNKSNNILLMGDSWMEQVSSNKDSNYLMQTFATENNFGIINAGVTSFSPSLMNIQFKILEKDFNFKPNVVVIYIDQTDIGDELCRYKDKRILDNNGKLIAVENEKFSRATYDYTKLYNISEIKLSNNSQIKKNIKLTNFFIKYSFFRFIEKTKSIKKHGWKNKEISKCRFNEIQKYLIYSNDNEINYFSDRIYEFINFLNNREYIEKIIFVTFPHKGHLFGHVNEDNRKVYYEINVSNIINKIINNNNNIKHINFSELFFNKEIKLDEKSFIKNDPGSHLKEEYHANIFVKEIINELK